MNRDRFPGLADGWARLDGPGGTQMVDTAIDVMAAWMRSGRTANEGGAFPHARASEEIVEGARGAVAEMLGASPEGVVFGPSMTSLTMAFSAAVGRTLSPGDEIVCTRLDHDANVAPWLLAAEDRGVVVRQVGIDPEVCVIDPNVFAGLLSERTRVAAFGWASNGSGTVNDVAALCALCREAGAISYVDAVHYAPHGPIDVAAVGCDFLVCSAYKFFGPHVGILFGRAELLERHRPYKVRPAPDEPPHSWETGTINLEGIAGTTAAIRYLTGLGIDQVAAYERELSARLLEGLEGIAGVTVYGTRDLDRRCPTYAFNVAGKHPAEVSAALGERDVFVWDGNYYALELMERLGLEQNGGAVRVGAAHYTTTEEIDRFLEAVAAL